MALRIIRAYEPIDVKRAIVTIYGGPGMRKTTIANTADAPLLIDFDEGAHRAGINRRDIAPIARWSDALLMEPSDFAERKTAVIDTVGRAIDKVLVHVIKQDSKNARNDGSPSLQGWGAAKVAFGMWLEQLKSYGLDIVLVLHATEEKRGDDIIERLDVQGGTRNEVHKLSDAMGRVYLTNDGIELNFSPSDAAYGKNPGNMPPFLFPGPEKEPLFLAKIITTIRANLNAENDTVREMRLKLEAARPLYEALDTAEKFTEQATNLSQVGAEPAIKMLLLQIAGTKGFTFDREKGLFVVKPAGEPAAPATTNAPATNGTAPARGAQKRGGRSSGNRRQA